MAYQKKTKSFVYNSSFNGSFYASLKNINLKPKKYVQSIEREEIGPVKDITGFVPLVEERD